MQFIDHIFFLFFQVRDDFKVDTKFKNCSNNHVSTAKLFKYYQKIKKKSVIESLNPRTNDPELMSGVEKVKSRTFFPQNIYNELKSRSS